jgi:hypothetical protein
MDNSHQLRDKTVCLDLKVQKHGEDLGRDNTH